MDEENYTEELKNGSTVYVPKWPASIALENLAKCGEFIGPDNLLQIAKLNQAAVMLAIMEAKDGLQTSALIKYFVCRARLDGNKITQSNYDSMFEGKLELATEIFSHVVKAQYSSFFESGLAEGASQD